MSRATIANEITKALTVNFKDKDDPLAPPFAEKKNKKDKQKDADETQGSDPSEGARVRSCVRKRQKNDEKKDFCLNEGERKKRQKEWKKLACGSPF